MLDLELLPPSVVSQARATSEMPSRASEAASAWTALPQGVVDGGEIILLAIKPSMWRPVFDSAPWLATAAALTVALTTSGAALPGLSLAATAQVIVMIGLARLGLAVVRWVPTWYVLTNRRIIDVQGVRMPRVSACPLVAIRNTYVRPTQAEAMASLGSIIFVSNDSGEPPRVWRSVPQADLVHDRIRSAIENAIDQHGTAP